MNELIDPLCAALNAGKTAEFTFNGVRYLIEQESNKGWDYISIWRLSPAPVCLARAEFELMTGITAETVRELVGVPCIEGHTLSELLPQFIVK